MELLIPLLFLPFFILLWIGITGLIAVIGGWRGLAQSNPVPAVLNETGVTYSFQSLRLGFMGTYNSSMNVTVYSRGIRLAPFFLFSVFHRPIYIGYDAMSNIEYGRFIAPYVTFLASNRRIRIYGKSADAMRDKLRYR